MSAYRNKYRNVKFLFCQLIVGIEIYFDAAKINHTLSPMRRPSILPRLEARGKKSSQSSLVNKHSCKRIFVWLTQLSMKVAVISVFSYLNEKRTTQGEDCDLKHWNIWSNFLGQNYHKQLQIAVLMLYLSMSLGLWQNRSLGRRKQCLIWKPVDIIDWVKELLNSCWSVAWAGWILCEQNYGDY